MIFHLTLSYKSPLVSTILLWILTNFSAPITINITSTFMFHHFFSFQARSRCLVLSLLSFSFIVWSTGTAKSTILQILFFSWLSLGQFIWLRLIDHLVSQNLREFCASYIPGWILGWVYTICSYSQISTSCTISCGSPSPLSHL